MKKIIFLLIVILLVGCSESVTKQEENIAEEIAMNLDSPWAIAKNNNTFFITERSGTIVKVTADGTATREEVFLSAPLSVVSEAGLMGFVLREDFAQSKEAYAYYTYDVGGAPVNRIVFLHYDGAKWNEGTILLDNVPSGSVHHGGRLALSPEGVLFATIGDGATPDSAQDLNSLNGKILALGDDNTFQIYSYGHRNPQGLTWDKNGLLYASEHGQSANDEINVIKEGHNYGWPIIEGTETDDAMESPIVTSGSNETWAPSGMTFHNGLLYVAALRGQGILAIDPNEQKVIETIEGFGRVRDVFSDGDSLYFITNNTDGRGDPSKDDDILYRLNRK